MQILKILNLKHTWEFILNENVIVTESNYSLLCQINKFILEGFFYNAGKIRNVPVEIGGSSYIPPLPIESIVKEELEEILQREISDIDKAIELLLHIMKKQIFIDGNKRIAVIFANHFLISKGKGLIIVPVELVSEYKDLLIKFYEDKEINNIKIFLKEKCFLKI